MNEAIVSQILNHARQRDAETSSDAWPHDRMSAQSRDSIGAVLGQEVVRVARTATAIHLARHGLSQGRVRESGQGDAS